MKLTEELFLMNKQKNRLKRFRKYENIAYRENDYIEINFGYIFKTSTNPSWKGSKIETVEEGYKEYEEMLKEGWKKLIYIRGICKNKLKLIEHFFRDEKLLILQVKRKSIRCKQKFLTN